MQGVILLLTYIYILQELFVEVAHTSIHIKHNFARLTLTLLEQDANTWVNTPLVVQKGLSER